MASFAFLPIDVHCNDFVACILKDSFILAEIFMLV
jgi:hypothetical protein